MFRVEQWGWRDGAWVILAVGEPHSLLWAYAMARSLSDEGRHCLVYEGQKLINVFQEQEPWR